MKIVVSNHKMNLTLSEVESYHHELLTLKTKNKIIVCPSFPYISILKNDTYHLGAQNVFHLTEKNTTGEVSAKQLKSLGVEYCIVGHSERRDKFSETDSDINQKIILLQKENITPILCIGETLEEKPNKETILKNQLKKDLENIDITSIIVAYEPIWSIGTGMIPTTSEIMTTIKFIKNYIKENHNSDIIVLYGGSVNDNNIDTLKTISEIDGYLIGGASLDTNKFKTIIEKLEVI